MQLYAGLVLKQYFGPAWASEPAPLSMPSCDPHLHSQGVALMLLAMAVNSW